MISWKEKLGTSLQCTARNYHTPHYSLSFGCFFRTSGLPRKYKRVWWISVYWPVCQLTVEWSNSASVWRVEERTNFGCSWGIIHALSSLHDWPIAGYCLRYDRFRGVQLHSCTISSSITWWFYKNALLIWDFPTTHRLSKIATRTFPLAILMTILF